jgi:hypothetical protein
MRFLSAKGDLGNHFKMKKIFILEKLVACCLALCHIIALISYRLGCNSLIQL